MERFNPEALPSPPQGLLSIMGYRVGANGSREADRRTILLSVFNGPLAAGSVENISEWGEDGTPARLSKMAHCIAAFANNALKRDPTAMARAIDEWSSDLSWLRQTLYVGRFAFPWPGLDARRRPLLLVR